MKLQEVMSVIDLQKQLVTAAKSSNTKFSLAFANHNLKKFTALYQEKYTKALDEKKLELALTDKQGALVFDEKGNYKFTKEAYKELTDYSESLFQTEVEFEFYKVKFSNLTEKETVFYIKSEDGSKEFFTGMITEDIYNLLSHVITELPELVYGETIV